MNIAAFNKLYFVLQSYNLIVGDISIRNVQTASPKLSEDGPAYIYFSQENILFKKNLETHAIYDAHEKIHQFENKIKTLDSHVTKNWIFLLDEMSQIFILDLNTNSKKLFGHDFNEIKDLSVDWLNDLIYVVTQLNNHYFINQCDFYGKCSILQIDLKGTYHNSLHNIEKF